MTVQEFETLWTNLVNRTYDENAVPLSGEEKLFYVINRLRGAVPRSGFLGYFENSTGEQIQLTLEALKELELSKGLKILQDAINIVWKNDYLPSTNSSLELFPDSLSEEEAENASNRFDEKLTPIEDDFNEYEDRIKNPSMYSSPRMIKMAIGINF